MRRSMRSSSGPLRRERYWRTRYAGQAHSRSRSPKKPQGHGFIAATSMMRAGKRTDVSAREIVTSPSSSGWRRPSRAEQAELGELVEEEDAEVGEAHLARTRRRAAADEAGAEIVWCGARNGRRATSACAGGKQPGDAVDARDGDRLVERERRHDAGQPPGEHGLARARRPDRSTLCAPATATSRARLTCRWPAMSDQSTSSGERRRRAGRAASGGGGARRSPRRRAASTAGRLAQVAHRIDAEPGDQRRLGGVRRAARTSPAAPRRRSALGDRPAPR